MKKDKWKDRFDEDVIPPDKSRINGWSYPPHPQQIIAWVFLIMFIVIYFWVMVPALPEEWQLLAVAINGIIITIHLIVHVISLSMDPADYNVRHKKQHGPMPKFDRSKHAHVIENEHCYLCQVDVGNKSKHCRACNKCVAGFDHHCKWLNNCVGSRNYKLFLGSVSTAFLASLIIFICSLFFINAYFFAKSLLQPYRDLQIKLALENISSKNSDSVIGNHQQENQILETKNVTNEELGRSNSNITCMYWLSVFVLVPDKAWLGVIGTTGALALIAAGLLGHLLCFHVYLMCKNMSTYDYVILLRERAAAKTEDLEDSAFTKAKKPKNNKISPADKEESVEMENKIKKEQQVIKVLTMEAEIAGETPPPPPLSNLDKPKMGRKIQKKKKKRRKKIIIGENISSITALNAANVSPIATIAVSSLYPNRTYSLIPKDYRKPIHAGLKKQKEQLPSDDSDSSEYRQEFASFNKRNPSLTNLYSSGSKQNVNSSLYSLPPLQPGQQPPHNCGIVTQVDTNFYPYHYPSEHNFVHRTTFHTNDRPLLLPVHNFQPSDFAGSVPGLKNFDINSQCSSTGSIYYTAVDTPLISTVPRSSGDGLTYGLVDPSPTLSDIGGLCLTKTCAPTPYNKYYY